MQNSIIHFYSSPQVGGDMPIFAGARRYQMGGGFFSSLARFAIPILRNIGGRALNVARKTATDVFQNKRPLTDSLLDNTIDEVKSAFRPSSINKEGGGGSGGDIFHQYNKRRKLA